MFPTPEVAAGPRQRALALVRRHGWNATAFQTLDDRYEVFFFEDACVAYVDTGSAWVAAGAPLTETSRLASVAAAFLQAAERAGRRCCFFATETRFVEAAAELTRSLSIGEQPIWDPRDWAETLRRHSSLREQLRRARRKGVRVRQVTPLEAQQPAFADATAQLVERWFATRAMPPMGFLVHVGRQALSDGQRCFVAEREGRLVGIARIVPVPLRDGWFVEHVLRDPCAPNGTVELLIDSVMEGARNERCTWLTLGLAPLAGEVPRGLRIARRSLRSLYDFGGIRRFKAKLRPRTWSPIHLTYPPSQGALVTLVDVLRAFAAESFLRFGARTLARGPTVAIALLAVALVPWLLLLASADTDRWFLGLAWLKWGWVGFDVLVLCGLVSLLHRPRAALATRLAVAVSADALATLVEALFWNVPRLRGGLDALIVSLACLAPAFAAIVLWGARARLRRLAPVRG